jgi:triosephosphate isomerase (TIM)
MQDSNKKYFIVGNWKMNQNLEDIKKFFIELDKQKDNLQACHAWIAPQSIHLPILKDLAFTLGQVKIGAQNCCEEEKGAYTGETSPSSLKDLGAHFVILGHSERRSIYKESNQLINKKVLKASNLLNQIILCVGETLDERENDKTNDVIKNQVVSCLQDYPADSLDKIIIAYEPVWAIGTGKTATPEQANEVHLFIKSVLNDIYPENKLDIPILYGGSVKPTNVHELLSQNSIDGALVGGASLNPSDYISLCTGAISIAAQR